MIKTKLIQLSYKVKNNKNNNDKSILQKKEDPYNRLCNCSKRGKKTKTPNAPQSNNHNKSVIGDWVNSPQVRSNTHDPFQYSIISVF